MNEAKNMVAMAARRAWAMKPDVLAAMMLTLADAAAHDGPPDSVARRIALALGSSRMDKLAARRGEGDLAPYDLRGSVAVIPVGGVILKGKEEAFWYGGTSTQGVQEALAAAKADARVKSAMVLVHSPGGSVEGVADLAQSMRDFGASKPLATYSQDLAASAGLWIASQSATRYANESAMVGSIGVYTVLADVSAMLQQWGIDLTLISTGEYKGLTADGKVTDAAKADVQREVNDYLGLFVQDVARGTGLSESHVKSLADGRVHLAGAAKAMGLVTAVADLGTALAEMEARYGSGQMGKGQHGQLKTEKQMAASVDGPSAGAVAGGEEHGTTAPAPHTQKGFFMDPKEVQKAAGSVHGGEGGDENGGGTAVIGKIDAHTRAEIEKKAAKAEGVRQRQLDAAAAPWAHLPSVASLLNDAKADTNVSVDSFKLSILDQVAKDRTPVGTQGGALEIGESGAARFLGDASVAMAVEIDPKIREAVYGGGKNAEAIAGAMGRFGQAGDRRHLPSISSVADLRKACDRVRNVARVNVFSMQQMARAYLGSMGVAVPHDPDRIWRMINNQDRDFRATHGTSDFPLSLANTHGLIMQAAFQLAPATWRNFARVIPANDYKEQGFLRVHEMQDFVDRPEGSANTYATTNERKEGVTVGAKSTGFKYTYQMFRNDSVGLFLQIFDGIRQAAIQKPEKDFYALLQQNSGLGPNMSDGKAMFHADHQNIATSAAFSYAAITAAKIVARRKKGGGKDQLPLDIAFPNLLVPPELEVAAGEIVGSTVKPGTGAEAINVRNAHQGMGFTSSPRLTSSTRWWLAADVNDVPAFVAAFLDGKETPEIVENLGQSDQLNMTFDAVIYGFGIAAANYEAMVTNAGT